MTSPIEFGRYHLVHPLASGGLADVFAAVTAAESGFVKWFALKRINEHLADDGFVQMFAKEARIVAELDHPNIIPVVDFGVVDGRHFIAMEMVRGQTLAALLERLVKRRQTMPVEFAVLVGRSVAAALQAAHEHKGPDGAPAPVIHRDVSPSNILISYSGVVKLTDFGIATVGGGPDASPAGVLKGKVAYMSPEQARGESVNEHADIFSLGVVLHEALTSRRLFRGDSYLETLRRIRSGDVPPPSSVNSAVPARLDQIVLKALAPIPQERFSSAREMGEALDSAVKYGLASSDPEQAGRFLDRLFFGERATLEAALKQGAKAFTKEPQATPPVQPAAPTPTDDLRQIINDLGQGTDAPPVSRAIDQLRNLGPASGSGAEKSVILVVDDLEQNRDMLTRRLNKRGFHTLSADSGATALAIIDKEPVDLVLLDINMPGQDGFAVLDEIRRTQSIAGLPVIMVTARDGRADIVRALKLGANDYISKPLDIEIVSARVQTQLLMKVAFESLGHAHQRYKALTENSRDVIFQLTPNHTCVYVSPASQRILGISPAEIEGQSFLSFVHQFDRPDLETALTQGPDQPVLARWKCADGQHVWLEMNLQRTDEQTYVSARDINRFVEQASVDEPPLPGGRNLMEQPGWRVSPPEADGVTFELPEGAAYAEVADALSQAGFSLQQAPGGHVRITRK